jgi:hypothetical protein
VTATTTIGINGAGLTGTLRLTWLRDHLAHVIERADTDEPSGTWIGLACPDYGLPIGSDVDLHVLGTLCADSEVADLVWEAPDEMAGEHNRAFDAAMRAYHAGHTKVAEGHWRDVEASWSRAWAANCAALEFMQGAGLDRFGPDKPQRWLIASFEHHCGPHGIQHPHVHNIVVVNQTGGRGNAHM